MLEIIDLHSGIQEKEIVKGINLKIGKNELHVLMGPNASGKTTLLKTIIGDKRYKILKGKIIFNKKDITNLEPFERVKAGIVLAFQHVPKISVKTYYFLEKLSEKFESKEILEKYLEILNLKYLLDRELFKNFSGGEIKRVELLISLLQKPKILMLDEIDSGVDIDSIKTISKVLNELKASVLLVTHTGQILKYVKKIDFVHVMINGKVVESGKKDLAKKVLKYGYEIFK